MSRFQFSKLLRNSRFYSQIESIYGHCAWYPNDEGYSEPHLSPREYHTLASGMMMANNLIEKWLKMLGESYKVRVLFDRGPERTYHSLLGFQHRFKPDTADLDWSQVCDYSYIAFKPYAKALRENLSLLNEAVDVRIGSPMSLDTLLDDIQLMETCFVHWPETWEQPPERVEVRRENGPKVSLRIGWPRDKTSTKLEALDSQTGSSDEDMMQSGTSTEGAGAGAEK